MCVCLQLNLRKTNKMWQTYYTSFCFKIICIYKLYKIYTKRRLIDIIFVDAQSCAEVISDSYGYSPHKHAFTIARISSSRVYTNTLTIARDSKSSRTLYQYVEDCPGFIAIRAYCVQCSHFRCKYNR